MIATTEDSSSQRSAVGFSGVRGNECTLAGRLEDDTSIACVFRAGEVLPSRQKIRAYADSEGVAPGYSGGH